MQASWILAGGLFPIWFCFFYLLLKRESLLFFWLHLSAGLVWLAAAWLSGHAWLFLGAVMEGGLFFYAACRTERQQEQIAEELRQGYEQQTWLLDELRAQRHDLNKQLAAASAAGSESYKHALQERYYRMDRIIRNEDHLIAGALYAAVEQAEQMQLDLTYSIQHRLSDLPCRDQESVSLISNILSNALEAAQSFQQETGEKARIQFSCRKQSGLWLLTCRNDSLPLDEAVLDGLYTRKALSTKGQGHEGFGTQQIARIVKAHQGMLDFSMIGSTFTLKLKIPAIYS